MLTPEARAGWDRLLDEHGRTFTSVIEALGRDLADGSRPIPGRVLEAAARIDRERYSRS